MGVVYRVTDTVLKRQVALKVLPPEVTHDPERVARFQREAELLAALNHPNIAHLYGIEKSNGTLALVMELVEGQTLAERIREGPIPIDEALPIAKQIADALEAAHERGIVHRDLKPANIKVRNDGTVKVLDFGLAKLAESTAVGSHPPGALTQSPTITAPAMTMAGVLLGTAAYMSPEQARGRAVNKRTDVWAFGCVLYEMLTGKPAFEGEDVAETIGAVIHKQPDWSKLPSTIQPAVRTVLHGCLQKNPQQRIRDIGDVQLAVDGAFETTVLEPDAHRPITRRPIWIALASACLAGLIVAAAAWALKPAPRRQPLLRSRFVLSERPRFLNGARQWLDISPDGRQLVFATNGGLFLRSLSEFDARALISQTPSSGFFASSPVFSPDGRDVAYFEGTSLKRLAIAGGSAVTVGQYEPPWGVSWSEAGILVGQGTKGIGRISERDGTAEQLVQTERTELAAHPWMLPGGNVVLFSLASNQTTGSDLWDKARIVALKLDTGERKILVEGGSNARYLPTGHLVYTVGGTLLAVPFDARNLETTGAAVQVEQNIRRAQSTQQNVGISQYAVTNGGTLVFVPGGDSLGYERRRILLKNRSGGVSPLALPADSYVSVRVSPDGKRLVFDTDDGQRAIVWIYDLDGTSQPKRLTFDGRNRLPIWARDGRRVLFQSDRDGSLGLYLQPINTSAAERLTTPEPGTAHVPESWSPTEDRFSFSVVRGDSASLWTYSLPDGHESRFGSAESTAAFNSEFSRNGRWLAYTLRPGDSANVFVEPFPATGDQHQITTANGHHPVWMPDGKKLSYRVGDTDQVVVEINTMKGFSVSNPTSAVTGGLPTVIGPRSFDTTPDGQAFVAVAPFSDAGLGIAPTQEIRIVHNWLDELKARVPTGR